ncbi:MAG TPA: YbaB/EbfC family nucleoid-associated protein [bacterium]|nr:YbaB/EbfC family nucleoid-associated protein [bacterium]
MFSSIKDLYQLQSKAKELQKKMSTVEIETESHGVKVKMNGNQEVLNLTLNPQLDIESQQKYAAEAFNEALKKVQHLMAEQMMTMN